MSVFATSIAAEIDFERDGKQVCRPHPPNSVTRSAYGVIPIPVAVVKNGSGPTVLPMAGNHGDEYEGQIALGNPIRELESDSVAGRVIVLPSANLPAARAGRRTSTLDGANLNRIFPADPRLGPIRYIEHRPMAMADILVDLHSGGASLAYLPFVAATLTGDAALDRESYALMRAFGGPHGHISNAGGSANSVAAAAATPTASASSSGACGAFPPAPASG